MNAANQIPTMNEDAPTHLGPGGLLRAARESAGVNLRDICAQLHLDERTINALEHDDFENLPTSTFVRGYLRGYARLLDVPVGPVMEAYDREGFRLPDLVPDIAEAPESNATDFPISLVTWVVVLILGAMVIVWWNNNTRELGDLLEPMAIEGSGSGETTGADGATFHARDEDPVTAPEQESTTSDNTPRPDDASAPPAAPASPPTSKQSQTAVPAPEDAGSAPLSTAIIAQDESDAADTTTRTDEVLAQAREALVQSRQSIASPTAASAEQEQAQEQSQSVPDAATSEQPAPQDAAPLATASAEQTLAQDDSRPDTVSEDSLVQNTDTPPSSATGQMHLELKFAEEAWVEIYDRDDNRLFYDLAKPGQTADLRGIAPLRVLLGRARGVEVQVDGKPFDVVPFVEKGMARFTLP